MRQSRLFCSLRLSGIKGVDVAEIRVARTAQMYCPQDRYSGGDRREYSPRVKDSVQFSPEALEKLDQLKAARQNRNIEEEKAAPAVGMQQGLDIFKLGSNASPDDVRRAYLLAVNRYHPDRFANQPPEFQKLAEEKTKEINKAYQMLKKA